MSLVFIYIIALSFPGVVLLSISRLSRDCGLPHLTAYNYLLSISLSYAVLVITLFVFRVYGETATDFLVGYFSFVLLVILLLIVLWLKRKPSFHFLQAKSINISLLIPIVSLSIIFLYLLKVGPYLEIPSDAWWHVAQIQDMYQMILSDEIPRGDFRYVSSNQLGFWYYIAAMMINLSGIDFLTGINYLSYMNNLLFLSAFYCFALIVIDSSSGLSRVKKHSIAAVGVLFTVIHFGVSEFSFVRYYAYAPVMLNFVLLMTSIILFFKYMQLVSWFNRYLIALAFLLIAMRLVHLQEILLLSVIVLGLMIYQFVLLKAKQQEQNGSLFESNRKKVIYGFFLTIIAYIVMHVLAARYLLPSNPFELSDIIPYESIFPFMEGWRMVLLDPKNKFYEVVTSWGLIVYVLYFLKVRVFLGNPYLMVGMLMPFFTVFNPIFMDLFLRVSYPEVVYRLCYTIPLALVGAYLLIVHISELFAKHRVWFLRIYNLLAAIALIIFLLPASQQLIASPSRIVTLKTIKPVNDYRQWMPLIHYLNSLPEKKEIHTDKITGYVLNGVTRHRYRGFKFTGEGAVALNAESFRPDALADMAGDLLVVNLQDGGWSLSGIESGHWLADILYVSRYYSPNFLAYIENNKNHFKKVWSNGKITVYEIN